MAGLIVPSRFACLKIEDDDEDIQRRRLNKKPAQPNHKTEQNKKATNNKNDHNKKNVNVKPNANQTNKKKQGPKNQTHNSEQWMKWQERDLQLVDNYYEKDLEEALLLSKLEFDASKKRTLNTGKVLSTNGTASNSKKSKPLSLHDFNDMVDRSIVATNERDTEENTQPDSNFFGNIDCETKKTLRREQYKTIAQLRPLPGEPASTVAEKSIDFKEKPEEKPVVIEVGSTDKENTALNEDYTQLKNDYERLQKKYKKLCSILREGEMKDKTALLIEIERLTKTQADLTAEITSLYAQLEQEKTKSHHEPKYTKDKSDCKKSVKFNEALEIIPILKSE